jgi:hypothetical protein
MTNDEKNMPNPEELAAQLRAHLEEHDFENTAELREQLTRQAVILDQIFYTSLHSAGFGQTTSLSKEPLAAQNRFRRRVKPLLTPDLSPQEFMILKTVIFGGGTLKPHPLPSELYFHNLTPRVYSV